MQSCLLQSTSFPSKLALCKFTRRRGTYVRAADKPPKSQEELDEAAKAFRAPEGEPELWWVEKFEARRKLEAASQPQLQTLSEDQDATQEAATSVGEPQASDSAPSSIPDEAPSTTTETSSTSAHLPGLSTAISQNAASESGRSKFTLMGILKLVLQVVQLAVVLYLLILFPLSLAPEHEQHIRVWALALVYFVFFSIGAVQRVAKHGSLADRKRDKQMSTWGSRFRLVLFIVAVVNLHWFSVIRLRTAYLPYETSWYEVLGAAAMAGALFLHKAATQELGKAWDRIVAPQQLVTTGVYAHIQHPIYTSYMMLFWGFAMVLHSAPCALLFLLVCLAHYSHRIKLEAQVLQEQFAQQYTAYQKRTKRFIPLLF